jgi:outer membrane biosynthesis protein TonB
VNYHKNPAPPKPKLPLYKGGTGTGGNGAVQDNGYRNQGYKTGNGDAGSPEGKPDSYGNSPGGRSGVSVVRGLSGRRPIHFPSMQDEFNENAKVYVDIKVNASGIVTNASIAKGTTTSNSSLRSIALQKAKQLKFPSSQNDEETGTILFNFILKS